MRPSLSSRGDARVRRSIRLSSNVLLGVFNYSIRRHRVDPGAKLARPWMLRDERRKGRVRGGLVVVASLWELYAAVRPLDGLPRGARVVLHARYESLHLRHSFRRQIGAKRPAAYLHGVRGRLASAVCSGAAPI